MFLRSISGICGWILALIVLLASEWGQARAEEPATKPMPSEQTITLAELEGAEIQVKIVREQVVRREGRQFPVTVHVDWKLVIGPNGTIEHTNRSTSHSPRGTRASPTRSGSFVVDQARDVKSLGGGRALYQFKEGTLTFLRTFKDGAIRRSVTFGPAAEGLTCTATESLAREKGTGSIVLNSPIDDTPITIVSSKQTSSSCRVKKTTANRQDQPAAKR